MKIDLTQIETEPLTFAEEVQLAPVDLDEDQVGGVMVARLAGTVRRVGDEFWVDGTVAASGPLVCSRCLEPVPWQTTERYSVGLRATTAAPSEEDVALDEGDLDVIFVDEPALDLARLAAEQILLALPMRILCSDACRGLCPTCRANRNQPNACRCEPEGDPRWAALRDLGPR